MDVDTMRREIVALRAQVEDLMRLYRKAKGGWADYEDPPTSIFTDAQALIDGDLQ
jgi:hypothetical protein